MLEDSPTPQWTLGMLIGKLLDTYVVVDGTQREILVDDAPVDVISFGVRMNIQMTAEDYARTRDGLKELVDLRNGLVHHFIERYDLWQAEGCVAAQKHLADCHARIDGHHEQLRSWAEHLEQARQLAVSFMQSPVYHDLVVNGIAPDGSVDWRAAGCVGALRKAHADLAIEGWTSLDAAIDWIGRRHPEQTPEKYGCRGWPQVIHESRQFQLRYREEENRRVPWYRDRQK